MKVPPYQVGDFNVQRDETQQLLPASPPLRASFQMPTTYPLLGELSATLVLTVAKEFDDASLIRCEASNLLDDGSGELGALAQATLGPAHAGLDDSWGGFLDIPMSVDRS